MQNYLPMLEPLEETICPASMSFSEDSHAKIFQLQAMELAWKAHVLVFGGNLQELLAKLDQKSFCWKTFQQSFIKDVGERMLLQTLPKWGIAHNGELSRLLMQERHTLENDGFAWQSPNADDYQNRKPPQNPHITKSGTLKLNNSQGERSQVRSSQQVKYYQTRTNWHTLIANDALKTGDIELKQENGLSAQIRWATLTKSDSKGTGESGSKSHTHDLKKGHLRAQITKEESGYMNPAWAEMLMGYPQGWTEID